jgi:hypothetical protein
MNAVMWDTQEQVPYSATLAEATRTANAAAFRAVPPVASPAESMNIERNVRLRDSLREAVQQASKEDDALPSLSASENFEALLRLLPAELPATEAYISPSGSICFDWDSDPSCQLSILLKDKNQVAFAAYFSGEKVHGSTRFSSHELPEIMATVVKRWVRNRRA